MTRVKICGLMNKRDIDVCIKAGAHMLGFVVDYPVLVPWNLAPDEAGELIQQVPPFVSTCVVTGGSVDKVLDIVNKTKPDVVQLHYKETLQEVKELANRLRLQGIKTVKALRIGSDGNCDFEIADPAAAARELCKTGVSAILVDSYTASKPAGTGVGVDMSIFMAIQKETPIPVILAGGLRPDNILHLVRQTHPYAVDVLTGVEESPGCKDPEKVNRFIRSVQLIQPIQKI